MCIYYKMIITIKLVNTKEIMLFCKMGISLTIAHDTAITGKDAAS